MIGPKLVLMLALACCATAANAQWSVTNLHPAGTTRSAAHRVNGAQQGGYVTNGTATHATVWAGSAATWVDLHPAEAAQSEVYGLDGGKQYGFAQFGSNPQAGSWNGTSASWTSLHPAGATQSRILNARDGWQVGNALWTGGNNQASLWHGTAASWVSLHPAGATFSYALGCDGGKQVGRAIFSGVHCAILWSGTATAYVNLSPSGSTDSGANCVQGGKQGGYAQVGGVTQASLWSGTASSWLSLHPSGAATSVINDMSGDLQAGYARFGTSDHAGVWTGTAASFEDLHALLPTTYSSSQARAIWRSDTMAYVVGHAKNSLGEFEAVMWTKSLTGSFALSLNKSSVAGQNSVQGTITMNAAPATNTVFNTWDNSSLVTTPPSVTVLMGTTTKNFQITTTAITSTINTTIYAQRGAETKSQPLTLTPLIPTAMSFTPNPVTGGQSTSCKLVINGVAGPGGRTIAILDNSPNATVPATVVVPAGATSVTFPITTTTVTAVKTVTVTARVSAGEKTATFRINP